VAPVSSKEQAPSEYLIVGLGNPGPKYAANRHNVGFHCVERLALAHDLTFDRRQKRARVARGTIQGQRVVLAKPQTFMNKSGRAVVPLAHFYKVHLERLLVIYDDLDLPLGTVRLRPEGGSGGHKGMRSIIEHLGTQDFSRLRIGIGRPPGRMDPAAYVLQDFSAEEEELLVETLERAVDAIEAWMTEGVEVAMNQYNRGQTE
jgi:PTH1 family peptidyl-tRNA hydrolase